MMNRRILGAVARRAGAVVMTAVLVTSYTPGLGPIASAYADSPQPAAMAATLGKADGVGSGSSAAPTSAADDHRLASGLQDLSITVDSHPKKGANGSGSVFLTERDVAEKVEEALRAKGANLSGTPYSGATTDEVLQKVGSDAALGQAGQQIAADARVQADDIQKNPGSHGIEAKLSAAGNSVVKGSLQVTDLRVTGLSVRLDGVELGDDALGSSSDQVRVSKRQDGPDGQKGWLITAAPSATGPYRLSVGKAEARFSYRFDFTYAESHVEQLPAPAQTPAPSSGSATGAGQAAATGASARTATGSAPSSGGATGADGNDGAPAEPSRLTVNNRGLSGSYPLGGKDWSSSYQTTGGKRPFSRELSADEASALFGEVGGQVRDAWASFDGAAAAGKLSAAATFSQTADVAAPGAPTVPEGAADLIAKVDYGDAKGYFELKASSPSKIQVSRALRVTGEAGRTARVSWSYPDGKPVMAGSEQAVQEVTVVVNPLALDAGALADQPFRVESDQVKAVVKAANEAVAKKAAEVNRQLGLDAPRGDYYGSGTSFASYDGQGAQDQPLSVEWQRGPGVSDYQNFSVKDPTVTVKAIREESWPGGLALTGNDGSKTFSTPDEARSGWFHGSKGAISARYAGHQLYYYRSGDGSEGRVPADAGMFGGRAQGGSDGSVPIPDSVEGTNEPGMYARDEKTSEVTRITGVAYRYDSLAPTIGDARVSSPRRSTSLGGMLFAEQQVDVEFSVIDDAAGAKRIGSGDVASGVDRDSVKASYDDAQTGEKGVQAQLTREGDANYRFSITGDHDVATKDIRVTARDQAGNELDSTADKNKGIPLEYTRLVSSADAPKLTVRWDSADAGAGGRYFSHDRALTVTIEQKFIKYSQQLDGGQTVMRIVHDGQESAVPLSAFKEVSADRWEFTKSFTSDGDWQVRDIRFQDLVGRTASADDQVFAIDKTAPSMRVSFDDGAGRGGFYNHARTATVTVTERYFDPALFRASASAQGTPGEAFSGARFSGWSGEGDVHVLRVTFPGQGSYSLQVSGTDRAGNRSASYQSPAFTVDTVKPQVKIEGVQNKSAYPDVAQPLAAVHDANLDPSSQIRVDKISYKVSDDDANPYTAQPTRTATDLSAAFPNPSKTKGNDGVYTMTVTATDRAGNSSSQAVTWSVNRFGSTYVLSDETRAMSGSYLRSEKLPDIKVSEINPSGLDESQTALELTRDTQTTTLKKGSDYEVAARDEGGWHEYDYTVKRDAYAGNGTYRLLLHSRDTAGNISENTMDGKGSGASGAQLDFAVDDVSPLTSFVGLASGSSYEGADYTAKVAVDDNLKLDHAVIKVNGQTYATLDKKALESSDTHDVVLKQGPDRQSVEVEAYDAAGNVSQPLTADDVLVSSDPVALMTSNRLLMVGLAALVVAAAGVWAWRTGRLVKLLGPGKRQKA